MARLLSVEESIPRLLYALDNTVFFENETAAHVKMLPKSNLFSPNSAVLFRTVPMQPLSLAHAFHSLSYASYMYTTSTTQYNDRVTYLTTTRTRKPPDFKGSTRLQIPNPPTSSTRELQHKINFSFFVVRGSCTQSRQIRRTGR